MIVDIVFGFLGSGKTTFISRVLQAWGAEEKIVVLMNEFGDVGIDGELLTNQGGNVVEMPSGCICCTLQVDFRAQMLEISRTLRPERVIIEPTGVATIAQVRSIVEAELFEDTISEIHNIMITDTTGFMQLYKANRHFVESQVKDAHLALLNKCDRVDKRKAMVTQAAISAINPDVAVLTTEFCAVDWAEYHHVLSNALHEKKEGKQRGGDFVNRDADHHAAVDDGGFHPHFHEEQDALGYESLGCVFDDLLFDQASLEDLFRRLNDSESAMGEVVRAKGIFRVGTQWRLMELASGEFSMQPVKPSDQSKVSIIGKVLQRDLIHAGFQDCISAKIRGD